MIKRKLIQIFVMLFCFSICSLNLISANNKPIILYMKDGQIYKKPVKICVTNVEITEEMSPSLKLNLDQIKGISPTYVIPNQTWSETIKGTDDVNPRSGTILYFNLKKFAPAFSMRGYSSRKGVFPILTWEDGEEFFTVMSEKSVWLVNKSGAIFKALITIGIFFIFLFILVKQLDKNLKLIKFLFFEEGIVSMSSFQLAAWTIAIGTLIIWHAYMRYDVPHIPENLLILMGFSAGTGVWGYYQSRRQHQADKLINTNGKKSPKKDNPEKKQSKKIKLSSMLFTSAEERKLSIEKAQLLFWTYITIIIFVVKSYDEGQLWNVPYQLVALMGISQATFLGKKQIVLTETETKVELLTKK